MTARYRLIHFSPDPFTGARFPLGAVIADGEGAIHVAKVHRLPTASCLGDRQLFLAVRRLHARLDSLDSIEALPAVFGPYATMADPRQVPVGVTDAVGWVRGLLDPPRREASKGPTPRRPHRSSLGYRFFQTWRVSEYVRKTFKPRTDGRGWLEGFRGLNQVSHWVQGRSETLLMEPVLPGRRQLEKDIQEIAEKFLAYRYALGQADNGRRGRLIVYLPAGGHPDQRAGAVEALRDSAHEVVDTMVDASRESFLEEIRRLGTQGAEQRPLVREA